MKTTGSVNYVLDASGTESIQDVQGPSDEIVFTHTAMSQDYATRSTTPVQTQDSRGDRTLEDPTHQVLGELDTQQISTPSPSNFDIVQRYLPVAPPRDVCEALDLSEPGQSQSFDTVTSELRTSEFPIPRPYSPFYRDDNSCPASPSRSADIGALETDHLFSATLQYPQSLDEQLHGNTIPPNDDYKASEPQKSTSGDIAPSVQEAPPIPEVNVAESELSKLEANAAPILEVNTIPSPDRVDTEIEWYGQFSDKNEVLGQNTVLFEETCPSFAGYPYRSPNLPPSSPPSAQISPIKLSPRLPDRKSAFVSKRTEKPSRDEMENESITHEKLFLSSPPLVSSPLPSSPPALFSSPQRRHHHFSPPTSPPPADCSVKDRCTVSRFFPSYDSPITNRNPAAQASLDEHHTFAPDEDSENTTVSSRQHTTTPEPLLNSDQPEEMVQVELSPPKPPNPMRSTLASQRRQHKKLTTPFKTPLLPDARKMSSKHESYSTTKRLRPTDVDTERESTQKPSISSPAREGSNPSAPLRYSQGAARQFRSPFVQRPLTLVPKNRAVSTLNAPKATSSSAAPTIQALQTKVQKLRQAIKIKHESVGEDGTKLEALIKKWKTVGREVAWQVWEIVKDTEVGTSNRFGGGHRWGDDESPIMGKKRGFDNSWGYGNEVKRARTESYDGGWNREDSSLNAVQDDPESDEGGNAGHHTLGTMLRYMGIAPETLGWDENEGDFVDCD